MASRVQCLTNLLLVGRNTAVWDNSGSCKIVVPRQHDFRLTRPSNTRKSAWNPRHTWQQTKWQRELPSEAEKSNAHIPYRMKIWALNIKSQILAVASPPSVLQLEWRNPLSFGYLHVENPLKKWHIFPEQASFCRGPWPCLNWGTIRGSTAIYVFWGVFSS